MVGVPPDNQLLIIKQQSKKQRRKQQVTCGSGVKIQWPNRWDPKGRGTEAEEEASWDKEEKHRCPFFLTILKLGATKNQVTLPSCAQARAKTVWRNLYGKGSLLSCQPMLHDAASSWQKY